MRREAGKQIETITEKRMKFKLLAAASLAMAMGNTAQAAIAVDTDASPLGEVFLAVWDVSGTATYVQDLGISSRGTDWSSATYSIAVNSSAYNSILGGSNQANLRYALLAGVTDPGFAYQDLFFSAGAGFNVNTALTADPFTDLAQNMINLDDLTDAHNLIGNTTNYGLNVATTAGAGAAAIGNNPGSVFNGNFLNGTDPFSTFGLIDEALTFFRIGYDIAAPGDVQTLNLRQTFASWSFDGATLTYGPSAPIPLPAGVWLLGSALLGLVGVSRRRAAQLAN